MEPDNPSNFESSGIVPYLEVVFRECAFWIAHSILAQSTALHDYSSSTINKRHDVAARKDQLLEFISAEIKRHGLITRDIRQFDPSVTANAVTGMRFQDRSCASVERLETIAKGLGFESLECAA